MPRKKSQEDLLWDLIQTYHMAIQVAWIHGGKKDHQFPMTMVQMYAQVGRWDEVLKELQEYIAKYK